MLNDVFVKVFGAPTQSGLVTVKEATIGRGTLIVFVFVQVAPVTTSKIFKLITCVPAVKVNAGGNGFVESTVEVVASNHCHVYAVADPRYCEVFVNNTCIVFTPLH